jgi:hypothetical protein
LFGGVGVVGIAIYVGLVIKNWHTF